MLQKRLPKFRRVPEEVKLSSVTERDFRIIETIARYRFLATSDIVRLIGGNEDVTYRHLQQLYHKDLISRIALPKNGGHGEFIYFLDNAEGLRSLCQHSKLEESQLDWKEIRANRSKYRNPSETGDVGHFLFLNHEIMIGRFRCELELCCQKSQGRQVLSKWMQGSSTWNKVKTPFGKTLPHRPDAFFTLEFPNAPDGQRFSNFFYEADRSTSNLTRMKEKLEAHLFFLLKRQHEAYGIQKLRAVLVHTLDQLRAEQIRRLAETLSAEIPLAAHLFWFTSTEELQQKSIFDAVFTSPQDPRKRSLLD